MEEDYQTKPRYEKGTSRDGFVFNICRCNKCIKINIAVFPHVKPYGLVDTNVLEGPALLFTLKMEAASPFEPPVLIYQITRHHLPQDHDL